MHQFRTRIPKDIIERARGRTLAIPIGDGVASITISFTAKDVRCSLRTREPSEMKRRHALALGYIEGVWRALRATSPMSLTHRQATALAGELYRGWADGVWRGEKTLGIEHTPQGWVFIPVDEDDEALIFKAGKALLDKITEENDPDAERQKAFGPLVDRLLLGKGIAKVDDASGAILLRAFHLALRDAFAARERNAAGDYAADPKAQRFPAWETPGLVEKPATARSRSASLRGLLDDWWREAKQTGRKPSTRESYAKAMSTLIAFLGHDDASQVTPKNIVAFKDHLLATINPRNGKPLSAKTVKDSYLAGLKTVFGWAVSNLRMESNPASGVTLSRGKRVKHRSMGFTDKEASAILSAAVAHQQGKEQPVTYAAKRWVPWLCAYTGARVGEMGQLRKQDLRQEAGHWVITISPEAGTVKTNDARDVVLHPHIIETGFTEFVASSPTDYLFVRVAKGGDVLGPLKGLTNRLAAFSRAIVPDPGVQPNHGWRHRFKTIGMQAGIDMRVLDAIQGHAPRTASDGYGDVSVRTQAAALAKLPRIVTHATS
jgi:integrase